MNVFSKVTDQTVVAETTLTMNLRVEKDICAPFTTYFLCESTHITPWNASTLISACCVVSQLFCWVTRL